MVCQRWAVQWRSDNKLDGKQRRLLWAGERPLLFYTRRAAREYIHEKWGYIKLRPELQQEPHGWKMPLPVKVRVTIKEVR